jgi:hypothetical protein
MMKPRQLMITALLLASATPALQAGPNFSINAGGPPGPSGAYGSITYSGPNDFSGTLGALGNPGILGYNTPLNSGNVFNGYYLTFEDMIGPGHFQLQGGDGSAAIAGTFTGGTLSSTGGTLDFTGFLSSSAAAFFGINPYAEMVGTFTLQLQQAEFPGPGGPDRGEAQLAFAPDGILVVPEPASAILLGLGFIATMAFALRSHPGAIPGKSS